MANIFCEDLYNRSLEISDEEVQHQLQSNPEATKMFAALLSLISLNSDEVDLDDWECQLSDSLNL